MERRGNQDVVVQIAVEPIDAIERRICVCENRRIEIDRGARDRRGASDSGRAPARDFPAIDLIGSTVLRHVSSPQRRPFAFRHVERRVLVARLLPFNGKSQHE
jgi:hypothetical protein